MVDFKKDFVLLLVDILVVLEIRFGEVDEIDMYFLIGFIIYCFDYFGIVYRLVYGLVIFVKQFILVRNVFRNFIYNIQVLSLEVVCVYNWLLIKFLYVLLKILILYLKELLRSIISNEYFFQLIFIVGDFNFDLYVFKVFECFMFEIFNFRYLEIGIIIDYNFVLD